MSLARKVFSKDIRHFGDFQAILRVFVQDSRVEYMVEEKTVHLSSSTFRSTM